MSAILQGADKAYLREYNESEDERRLDALQDSIGSIRKATKGGKYLGSDVIDIMVEIQGFAEKLGIDPDELEYAENQVREAMNNLESAIYGLEEPFEDAIRSLQNKIDDARMDAEEIDEVKYVDGFMGADGKLTSKPTAADYASNKEFQHMKKKLGDRIPQPTKRDKDGKLSPFKKDELEEMYDEKAFNNIFKDRKDKGTMERPKSKPKDTGMYNQPNKAERDKRENDNIDEESKGLWANIHAKRKRGEKPAKKGDKAYPKTLDIDEEKQRLDPKCWDGYKKQGTKMKGDKRVNNCVPVKESNILKGLNESQLDEGAKEKLIALGLAGALGLGALMPSAEDSPLGKELQAAAQAGDAVAAYHLNNLDLYTDEGMARTLVNLKIAYIDDSPREDVKAFLSDPKRFPALARK
jgi:hypothetical protein